MSKPGLNQTQSQAPHSSHRLTVNGVYMIQTEQTELTEIVLIV